jgi:tetratricopeptide (TPR) repeat protein
MTVSLAMTIVLSLALVGRAGHLEAASPELDSAKALYAAASYDEALSLLNEIPTGDESDQVDQYRALCLLALGRAREAEAPLEQIVARRPLYVMTENEASPKLVELFVKVRQRALPAVARDLYKKARASFDADHFSDAVAEFKQLMALMGEEGAGDLGPSVADLRPLSEGFLTLAEAKVAAAIPAAPPVVAAPPPPAAPVVPARTQGPRIYSLMDPDVVGPVDINRQLPAWLPPTQALARNTYRGTLSIVVDERGQVESAVLTQPVTPSYDPDLLAATRYWRFRPATKDGQPVKYQKNVDVVLRPR